MMNDNEKFWLDYYSDEKRYKILRRIDFSYRGVTLLLIKNLDFEGVYYLVQFCDGVDQLNIPKNWAKAILDLNEPEFQKIDRKKELI